MIGSVSSRTTFCSSRFSNIAICCCRFRGGNIYRTFFPIPYPTQADQRASFSLYANVIFCLIPFIVQHSDDIYQGSPRESTGSPPTTLGSVKRSTNVDDWSMLGSRQNFFCTRHHHLMSFRRLYYFYANENYLKTEKRNFS